MRRISWTTKTKRALICSSAEEAACIAKTRGAKAGEIVWSSSEHGFVIYNLAGTKMIADR